MEDNGADITAQDNYAVCWASNNGHLDVVKYLQESTVVKRATSF